MHPVAERARTTTSGSSAALTAVGGGHRPPRPRRRARPAVRAPVGGRRRSAPDPAPVARASRRPGPGRTSPTTAAGEDQNHDGADDRDQSRTGSATGAPPASGQRCRRRGRLIAPAPARGGRARRPARTTAPLAGAIGGGAGAAGRGVRPGTGGAGRWRPLAVPRRRLRRRRSRASAAATADAPGQRRRAGSTGAGPACPGECRWSGCADGASPRATGTRPARRAGPSESPCARQPLVRAVV